MKVVLFCGGLGTRLREHSDTIPKPLVNVGYRPIIWHLMRYYAHFGHKEFILALGYRGDMIREFFLNYRPHVFADCVVSGSGASVELLDAPREDWRVTLIDTGIWRNIGERLWAVREHLRGEEMFLANYSDGLTDLKLDEVIERFARSRKIACFLAIRPPLTYHLADIDRDGRVTAFRTSDRSEIWINGGYFVFRREIFDYMREGEDLVAEPFSRLIAEKQLMAYPFDGFWRNMDTFKDKQTLDELLGREEAPWLIGNGGRTRPRR